MMKKILLFVMLIFAIIGAIEVFGIADPNWYLDCNNSICLNTGTDGTATPATCAGLSLFNHNFTVGSQTFNAVFLDKTNNVFDTKWGAAEYNTNQDLTMVGWVNFSSGWINNDRMGMGTSVDARFYFLSNHSTMGNKLPGGFVQGQTYGANANEGEFSDSQVHHLAMVFNSGEVDIYVDGRNITMADNSYAADNELLGFDIAFGGRSLDGGCVDGDMTEMSLGEFAFIKSALPYTDILELNGTGAGTAKTWNGVAWSAAAIPQESINITSQQPGDNTQFTITNMGINITYNASNTTSVLLYINDTLNQTYSGASSGLDINVNFTVALNEGNWSYYMMVNDSGFSVNSSNNSFWIDITNPAIITSFTNNTVFYRQNITSHINFSDNLQLSSYNISIDGTDINNSYGLTSTYFQYNISYNVSTLVPGSHTLNITVRDGHTATEIQEYDWKNGLFNDYLQYNFGDYYVKISAKESSLFDSWSTEKKTNKYSFTFEPSSPSATQLFIVESNQNIHIVEKNGYYGGEWLIIGDKWIDFDGVGDTIKISRISPQEVEVSITGIKSPTLQTYNSIGDLNIVTKLYTFYTINATNTYTTPVIQFASQSILLEINKSQSTDVTDATLIYNGGNKEGDTSITLGTTVDLYNATFITPAFENSKVMNFTWILTVNTSINNISANITSNQSILAIGVGNCSVYTTPAINFSLFNESDDTYIYGDISAYMEVWLEDMANLTTFNISWDNSSNFSICIFPNNANYSFFTQMEYTAPGFDTRTYYFNNVSLDNITDTVNLYLNGEPETTIVTFTVTDEDDNTVQDVFIHVLSYDFGTDSYTTSEIIKTDSQGEALGNIVLNTDWYRFLLVYEGTTKLFTDPVKITGSSRNFRINLQTNFFDFFDTYDNTETSLTFTNATLNYAFTFVNLDGTGVTACLKVIERSPITDTLINKSCVTSAAGTILVNIGSDVDGKTYIGTGTIQGSPIDIAAILVANFDGGYKTYGKDGIFVTFFVRLGLSLIGIWNPVVAIMFLILADIGMISMGLFYMNWTTLIFYIILAGIAMYRMKK